MEYKCADWSFEIMIEPSKVSEAAKKRENENVKFRTFLKCNADSDELDRQFLLNYRRKNLKNLAIYQVTDR